jgi:predicted membrane protein
MNRSTLNNYILIGISAVLAIVIISVIIYVLLTIKNNKQIAKSKTSKGKENTPEKAKKSKFKVNSNALKFKTFDDSKDFKIENIVNDNNLDFHEIEEVYKESEEKLKSYNKKDKVKKSFKDFRKLK